MIKKMIHATFQNALVTTTIIAIPILTINAGASPLKSVEIERALRQPLQQRLNAIENQGPIGRIELNKMAFNKKETIENRWRAVTAMGRLFPRASRASLDRALQSPEWFMRNAALLVVHYGDRAWATKWARVLMHDPALVVRTAAVHALRQLNAKESQSLLWEKFYSSENFHAGKSLWVRRHILEALEQFATRGQEKNFIGVLSDSDESLHPIAIRALKKLTQENYDTPKQWQAWLNNRKTI